MNMQQPDPAGLFDQYQRERKAPPVNNSVTAQISPRPAPTSSIPPVNQPAPAQQPPQPVSSQPVNPFVALYESGAMEKSVQTAQQGNPFKQLYDSGYMTQSVLMAEDEQYQKALEAWNNRGTDSFTGMRTGGFIPQQVLKPPAAPARDLKQIEKDWKLGVHNLRGQELGNILGQIESASMTPEQEAVVTRIIEPNLPPELRKQLQISRLTRDKYLTLTENYDRQMAEQEQMREKPGLTPDERRQLTTPGQLEQLRGFAKGLTFNYAFAPDEDRLNSDNPDVVADERSKRWFYQQEEAKYPFSSMAGLMTGAFAPMGAFASALRAKRVSQATKALQAGAPTPQTAGLIARGGAPATLTGNMAEGMTVGLPYDLAYRPEGSEDMSLQENIEARKKQIGFGLLLSPLADLGLAAAGRGGTALMRGASKAAETVAAAPTNYRLNKLAKENNYQNIDEMLEDLFLKEVTDETGSRIQLKQKIYDVLPALNPEAKNVRTTPTDTQSTGRSEPATTAGRKPGEPPPVKETPSENIQTIERPAPGKTEAPVQGRTESIVNIVDEDPAIKELKERLLAPGEHTFVEPGTVSMKMPNGKLETFPNLKALEKREKELLAEKEKTVTTSIEGEATAREEPTTSLKVQDYEIVEAPIDELTLSADVPQFKSGADLKGVVEPLGGKFERTGVAPIQVWVRKDGTKEIISGRHRFDLAKRSGEETIPAQYHYESEGFGKRQAAALDATLNIREGQGKVKDYVDHIKATSPTKAEADAEGILARATGRRAYTIATEGSDALITAHRANQLTDEAATRIAAAAPNNEALQAVGIKAIQDGKSITVAENMVKAVKSMTADTDIKTTGSGDLFGFDDSALKEAEALARKAAAKQADIQKTLSAVQGAAKNPERAAKEGVDVKDPEAVKRRIEELKQEKQDWQNWHTNSELTAQLKGEAPVPKKEQDNFDLTTQTETELSAKQKSIEETEQHRAQQQQELEAKAKADTEAKDFELGIQGSGKDVSARQGDLLGLGGKGEQLNTRSQAKSEAETGAKPETVEAGIHEFVKTSSGDSDFGQVSPEIASEIGIESAPVRMIKGWHNPEGGGVGLTHIERDSRSKQILNAGYESISDFVEEITQNFNRVYKGRDGSLILAKVNGRDKVAYVRLVKNPDGKFYGVGSAHIARKNFLKNKDLLWERAHLAQPQRPPSALQDSDLQSQYRAEDVNPSGFSGHSSDADYNKIATTSQSETGSSYRPITNNPEPKAKDLKGGPYTLDYHNSIFKALRAGELSLDDFKAAFNALMDNKDEIIARLNKYKKSNLQGMTRQLADKKADAVQQAFEHIRNRFLLDNNLPDLKFNPFDFEQGAKTLQEARLHQEQQITDIVRNITQEDLDRYAKNLSKQVEKRKAEVAEEKARIANPQTLEDYHLAIRENGKDSLTTAQKAEYDRLSAEAQLQAKQQQTQKQNIKEGLETEDELIIEPVSEGTHTKTGETIYNVKIESRLGKEKFQEAAKTARSMGGGYWKGKFWLKTKEDAEQFVSWLNGQTLDRSDSKMKQETAAAASRAEKLRQLADKQEQQGTEALNAERRTNTARQMDQASSARAAATKKINFAQTLRNIANGIEEGTVRFLSKLSSMTQLEQLNRIKRNAVPHEMMDSSYNGYSMNTRLKEGVTLEDYIDRIKIPEVQIHTDNAVKLAEQLKGKRGYARLRQELEKQISIAKRSNKHIITLEPHGEYAGLLDTYARKNNADIGWLYNDSMEAIKRLQRMDLVTDEQLRSAIRELEEVKSSKGVKTPTERKLDELRFKIKQAARSFNDFFPTPTDVVNRVMELADIRPGMKTLEPNAGMGHMAEKLQQAAGKAYVDLVEMSGQLVDYLTTAGHSVKQSDFLKFGETDTYERIVMNPPFSKDQDIDHVMHAYDLLKPGGKLTAIMSNMAGLRSNSKNRAFSEWLDEVGAHVEDVEAGAFKSSFNPTSVNTKIVVIEKPLQTSTKAKASEITPEVRAAFEESQTRLEDIKRKRREEPDKINPRYQAYLDSLEDPATANNADFMAFTSKLANEYEQTNGLMPSQRGSKEWDQWHEGLDTYIKESVGNGRKTEVTPQGTTLYSSPVIPAMRDTARLLHLNPGASVAGAAHGAIGADQLSEEENFSKQWWLDVAFGAAGGALAAAGGTAALKSVPIKGKPLLGKTNSYGMDVYRFVGKQFNKLPGMNRGDKDVLAMQKQQQLLKALIERQAEKAGEYLLKNFTPAERSTMADLIQERGIIADGNLLHRQAKELDDFIAYTSKKLQDLGMLDEAIEPGGYLHRYYKKDLGLGGLARALTPKSKTLSGSWSKRRGTQEVWDSRYMSESMRQTMKQVADLQNEFNALSKRSDDLIAGDTQTRLDELKTQIDALQSVEFREYLAPQNGKIKSFFIAADEVPVIPWLKTTDRTGLPEPVGTQGNAGSSEVPHIGRTGQMTLTDRRWTIDGMKPDGNGILHRDWTKAERESWGEINDAAYRMVRGQAEVAHDLSLGLFFKQVDDQFKGSKVSDTAIEGWHQVPDTRVGKGSRMKKYGALSGKYVTEDVWKAIKNHGRNPLLNLTNNHPAVATYLKAIGKWKAYKTVYNPVSHMNNSVGNLQMYYLSDYEGKYLAKAFNELRKGENSDLLREARNAGLFGTDWTSTLTEVSGTKAIDDLLEKLRTQPDIPDFEQSLDAMMGLKQWFIESKNAVQGAEGIWKTGAEMAKAIGNPLINTASKPINKAANAMQNAYRLEDEFFKMAIYLAERNKGTKPFEAVDAANRYFFNYQDMPDGMKIARDFPVGSPFISYTYFAVPAIVRTAIEKPEKILALAAALEGINYAGTMLNGELQDQGYWDRMADEKALYPGWMQGRTFWGGVNNVSVPFLDSYKLSLANMNAGGNPFIGNSERSGAWPEFLSFWGAGPEGSNPMTKLLFDISRNEDWRSNPIWMEGAPVSEKIRKATNYIYQNITPSNILFPGSYHQQKALEGMANIKRETELEGEQPNRLVGGVVDLANAVSEVIGGGQFTGLDRKENDILFRDALYGSVGIKLRPIRVDQFEESRAWDLKKDIDDERKWIRKQEQLFSEGRKTQAQIEKDRKRAEKAFSEIEQEANRMGVATENQRRAFSQ